MTMDFNPDAVPKHASPLSPSPMRPHTPPPSTPSPAPPTHHEHGLPPRLDVGHARQHHLAGAANDELPDLQGAGVAHHHHKGAQEVVLCRGARGLGQLRITSGPALGAPEKDSGCPCKLNSPNPPWMELEGGELLTLSAIQGLSWPQQPTPNPPNEPSNHEVSSTHLPAPPTWKVKLESSSLSRNFMASWRKESTAYMATLRLA